MDKRIKTKEKWTGGVNVELISGTVFEFKKGHKYLLVMPSSSNIEKLAPALRRFFGDTPVFILTANQVNDVKIAELMEEV